MSVIRVASLCLLTLLPCLGGSAFAAEGSSPEEVLRTLVRANAEMDLATMSKLMAHDQDMINYTIGGRKYVGWDALARDLQDEFDTVSRLEMPIHELTVWTRGNLAWFAMELDYIRYVGHGEDQRRIVLPLRETGVLEQRHGSWVLVAWHESSRLAGGGMPVGTAISPSLTQGTDGTTTPSARPNLSGEWEIHEEDKSYTATLDRLGNGTYTWQGGRIRTTLFADRKWQGTWHQTGNDREGGFEVLLSEDGEEAKGVWWYTRVGDRTNIPERQWGGTYLWKRLTPAAKAIKGN